MKSFFNWARTTISFMKSSVIKLFTNKGKVQMEDSVDKFWDVGPHDHLDVETTWREFVKSQEGTVVEDILPNPRTFENADFLFRQQGVVAELKEIMTDFGSSQNFQKNYNDLMNLVVSENPDWKPILLGGEERYPDWFGERFIRLFRPPISRILKKANRQIRETKAHFGINECTGIILFVNDGFTSLGPQPIRSLAAQLLIDSYSSIDCFIYLTVNRYIVVPNSDVPRLLWAPTYSDRAPDWLVEFVDNLGSAWFEFLDEKIHFTEPNHKTQSSEILSGSYPLIIP